MQVAKQEAHDHNGHHLEMFSAGIKNRIGFRYVLNDVCGTPHCCEGSPNNVGSEVGGGNLGALSEILGSCVFSLRDRANSGEPPDQEPVPRRHWTSVARPAAKDQ